MFRSQFCLKICVFALYAFGVVFSADAFETDSATLFIPYQKQIKTNWCWAASASMVLNYYMPNDWIPPHSTIAIGQHIPQRTVAAYGTPGQSNVPNYMYGERTIEGNIYRGTDKILKHFLDLDTNYRSGPLPSPFVRKEIIEQEDPVIISWGWKNRPGGHMVVITGYTHFPGITPVMYHIQDPWYGPLVMVDMAVLASSDRWWRETLTIDQN